MPIDDLPPLYDSAGAMTTARRGAVDVVGYGPGESLRHGLADWHEDWSHYRLGVLDRESFRSGWRRERDPVQVMTTTLVANSADAHPDLLVRDPKLFTDPTFDGRVWRDLAWDRRRRILTGVRRQHNLQLRAGRDRIQIPAMYGDAGSSLNGIVAAYTGTTATTLTGSSGLPTATTSAGNAGLQGHIVLAPHATPASTVLGVIVSNTATAITVDQWYAIPITGAAGTTPVNGAGTAYILPGGSGWLPWVALTTSVSAAAATDVARTADGLWGDGTTGGAATETTTNGLARAFVGQGGATAPVITPGTTTSTIAFAHTWTYSGSGAVVLGKVVLFNSLAAAGSLPHFETLLNATGTVNLSGDTIALNTWVITMTTT
jgi:hypothetical protein